MVDCTVALRCRFRCCLDTLRSTSGHHLDVQGPNLRFPLSSGSNQQTAISQSTPEAETASADFAMKTKGEAALSLLGKVLGKYHEKQWSLRINAHEDNTTMLTVAATGKKPTMKTLERNHGV